MANQTKLYLNFVAEGDIQAPVVKKVILRSNKILQIKRVVGGADVVTEYNFANSAVTDGTVSRSDYSDSLYRYRVDAEGTVHLWIAVVVPDGTDMPASDYQELTYSAIASVWKIATENWTIETASGTQPDWIPGALTDAQKKARFVVAIKRWREQIKTWLLESPQYADLITDITRHLALWLRGADFVIYKEATKADADRYDWLILEAIVNEAIKGPRTLDANGDGAYDVEFFRLFRSVITGAPNGPTFGALWVQTWDLTQVSDVTRVNNFKSLILSHGSTNQYYQDRTYHNLPAITDTTATGYDATADYWSSL